jgi:hypothetical protein
MLCDGPLATLHHTRVRAGAIMVYTSNFDSAETSPWLGICHLPSWPPCHGLSTRANWPLGRTSSTPTPSLDHVFRLRLPEAHSLPTPRRPTTDSSYIRESHGHW